MASCPVVRLVNGGDAAVVNVGSPEEADLRSRGYAEPSEAAQPTARRANVGRSRKSESAEEPGE